MNLPYSVLGLILGKFVTDSAWHSATQVLPWKFATVCTELGHYAGRFETSSRMILAYLSYKEDFDLENKKFHNLCASKNLGLVFA